MGVGRRAPILMFGVLLSGCRLAPIPAVLEQHGRQVAEERGDWIPLEEKVAWFQKDLEAHYQTPQGILAYRVPFPYQPDPAAWHSDTLGWTSLWAAAEAMRYRCTANPDAAEQRDRALRGIDHLARISGVPGLLARTMVPQDPAWLEDTSHPRHWVLGVGSHAGVDYSNFMWKTDNAKFQVTGWTLGMHLGLTQVEDRELRADLLADLRSVSHRIVDAGYRLTEADGTPTRFGDLVASARGPFAWLLWTCIHTPIDLVPFFDFAVGPNAMIAVALARVHDRHCCEARFYPDLERQDYVELIRDGVYAPFKKTHHGNDLLTQVAAWTILETDPPEDLHRAVVSVIRSIWNRHCEDRNPFLIALAWRTGVIPPDELPQRLAEAHYTLQVFPRNRRLYSVDRTDLEGVRRQWIDRDEARHAMPWNLLPSSSFAWKSHPGRVRRATEEEGTRSHSGMDFLLAWWMLRDQQLRAGLPVEPESRDP